MPTPYRFRVTQDRTDELGSMLAEEKRIRPARNPVLQHGAVHAAFDAIPQCRVKTPSGEVRDSEMLPTLLDLILRNDFYDGCAVLVHGLVGPPQDASQFRLYLTTQDIVSQGGLFGRIRVSLVDQVAPNGGDWGAVARPTGAIALVRGVFVKRDPDTGNPAIKQVKQLSVWDPRASDAR
jgi:hypothetical protein